MKNCPTCGGPIAVEKGRWDFTMTAGPVVYWRGERLDVRGYPARILAMLAVRPRVTIDELLSLGMRSKKSLHVHMAVVRGALPAGVEILNDFGKSYALRVV